MNNSYSEGSRVIQFSIRMKLGPAQLFEAISTPHGLEQWFCSRCEERPFGFHAVWHMGDHDDEIDCAVIESQPHDADGNALFVIRWESDYAGHDTIARFEVAPDPRDAQGSILKFREDGFGEGPDWDRAYREQSDGWFTCFINLARYDERSANFRRRGQPASASQRQ